MKLPLPVTRRTLSRHLLIWTLAAQLAVWVVMVAVGWSTSLRETRKFTDGHLVAVAQLWLGMLDADIFLKITITAGVLVVAIVIVLLVVREYLSSQDLKARGFIDGD